MTYENRILLNPADKRIEMIQPFGKVGLERMRKLGNDNVISVLYQSALQPWKPILLGIACYAVEDEYSRH